MDIFHADHGISRETIEALVERLNPQGFFLRTVELPAGAPDAMNALHGPASGDAPVPETEVTYKQRSPDRPMSRMVARAPRPTRMVTIIGMAAPGQPVKVFTCYGGPAAEREPGDKSLGTDAEKAAAQKFWAEHALSL